MFERRERVPVSTIEHRTMRYIRGRHALLLVLAASFLLLLPAIQDMVLSGLLILEAMRPLQEGILSRLTPEPVVERVTYRGRYRLMEADLYIPGSGGRTGGVILVHGVNESGKADPRMIWIARLFARSGFVVLVPDFLGLKSLKLRAEDSGEMVDSFLYLSSLQDRVYPDRIGLVGFSYGAGPTLIAASDPLIRDKVRFVVSFGGYYDLVNIIRFITTGFYEWKGERFAMKPSDYDRWIFLRYNLDLLSDPRDKVLLARIAEVKAKDERVRTERWARQLTPEGRAIYHLLVNRDPDRVEALIRALPQSIQHQIERLSPSQFIHLVRAYVFVVHGKPDPFIPHTESLRLADALKENGRYHLGILRALEHVRPSFPPTTFPNLVKVYLPEGFKLYRLAYDLLSQRR